METFLISSKEVEQLHNGKVYLLYALESANDLLKPESTIVQNLRTSVRNLEGVITRLMREYDTIRDARYMEAKRLGSENDLCTIWSYTSVPSLHFASDIPVGSKIKSWYTENNEFTVVEGNTWLDVWKAADKLVKMTRDEHGDHIFVEGFRKVADNEYEVSLGS